MGRKEQQSSLPKPIQEAAKSLRQSLHEGHVINDMLSLAKKRNETAQIHVTPTGEVACAVGDRLAPLPPEGTIFHFDSGKFFATSSQSEVFRVKNLKVKK